MEKGKSCLLIDYPITGDFAFVVEGAFVKCFVDVHKTGRKLLIHATEQPTQPQMEKVEHFGKGT